MISRQRKKLDAPMKETGCTCSLCGGERHLPFSSHEDGDYFKCLGCGVIFSHPAPPREILLEQARSWARIHHAAPAKIASDFSPFIQKAVHIPRLRRIEKSTGKGRLLDLGCATGGFLHTARLEGWEGVGVECAEESAAYGRGERNLDIVTGFFPGVSFPDEWFHAATLWEFLEHVENPLASLSEAYRVLRSGGVLALSTPNLGSLTRVILGNRWDVLSPKMHLFLFTPFSLARLLNRAGFGNPTIFSEDLNPLRVLRGLRSRRKGERFSQAGWEEKRREMDLLKNLVQKRGWARMVRRGVNRFLHLCKLGDTLIAYAQK